MLEISGNLVGQTRVFWEAAYKRSEILSIKVIRPL